MRPSIAFNLHRDDIRRIVSAHRACNVRVFGSVLYGKDTESSDLDLLVDITQKTSLLDIAKIQNQLQQLLNVKVDVLTPGGIPERFRIQVLSEAHLV